VLESISAQIKVLTLAYRTSDSYICLLDKNGRQNQEDENNVHEAENESAKSLSACKVHTLKMKAAIINIALHNTKNLMPAGEA